MATKKKEQHICEIEFIPTEETPDADSFTGKFYQTFQEEKIAKLTQMIYKIENKGTSLNYFYEASFFLRPKPEKTFQENKIIE